MTTHLSIASLRFIHSLVLRSTFLFCLVALAAISPAGAFEFEDPTNGDPFIPWLWHQQLKPTIKEAASTTSLGILGVGSLATVVSHQYDRDVDNSVLRGRSMDEKSSHIGAVLGSGRIGIAIALAQIVFDQNNGLAHGRAIALTSLNHITVAFLTQRTRPNGSTNRLSFPSGHVSSAFATAGSLFYAYGPWVGVPAVAAAGFVASSRINDRIHWLSDTVLAATIGMYWARSSAIVAKQSKPPIVSFMPEIIPGGAIGTFTMQW